MEDIIKQLALSAIHSELATYELWGDELTSGEEEWDSAFFNKVKEILNGLGESYTLEDLKKYLLENMPQGPRFAFSRRTIIFLLERIQEG